MCGFMVMSVKTRCRREVEDFEFTGWFRIQEGKMASFKRREYRGPHYFDHFVASLGVGMGIVEYAMWV
jgi:hypothetical protein